MDNLLFMTDVIKCFTCFDLSERGFMRDGIVQSECQIELSRTELVLEIIKNILFFRPFSARDADSDAVHKGLELNFNKSHE